MPDVKETLALLFLLLCFALLASGYVLKTGLTEGKRSQYELVLRCVLILTAVVPPELPMQTAVAGIYYRNITYTYIVFISIL